ncbi:Hypothetical predicted protein [Olea europaea subsp. europaea]|uniref:Uncharacterized protein n=1 Tax=Olea europaea subsp. europaea TaxID=158383 RepID=A0A8S0SGC7_OLEEU|nr:Hypothetical predicted protein [Olea europaea subsp. europaea]
MEHDTTLNLGCGAGKKKKGPRKTEVKKWREMKKKLPELYEKKYRLLGIYKELCFYYYNTIRLGLKIKLSDKASFLGFLITRKPGFKAKDNKESVMTAGSDEMRMRNEMRMRDKSTCLESQIEQAVRE